MSIKIVDAHRIPDLNHQFGFDVCLAEDNRTPIVVNVMPVNRNLYQHRRRPSNINNNNNNNQNNNVDPCHQANSQKRKQPAANGVGGIGSTMGCLENGDQLLEISGVRVSVLTLGEIDKLLRCSGSHVLLKVLQQSRRAIVPETTTSPADMTQTLNECCPRCPGGDSADKQQSAINNEADVPASNHVDFMIHQPSQDQHLVPAAQRLAKRLFTLDGFRPGNVARELCKNTDFAKLVVEQFMSQFNFCRMTLLDSLRTFLLRFTLPGSNVASSPPTSNSPSSSSSSSSRNGDRDHYGSPVADSVKDRESILHMFVGRYIQCSSDQFRGGVDSCYLLVCAILLLNTDLHGVRHGVRHRKMSFAEFRQNLKSLDDNDDFDPDMLKTVYSSIKRDALVTVEPGDESSGELSVKADRTRSYPAIRHSDVQYGSRVFTPSENLTYRIPPDNLPDGCCNYKPFTFQGWLTRKCVVDDGGKVTSAIRRGWVRFYCRLNDMQLCFYRNESTNIKKTSISGKGGANGSPQNNLMEAEASQMKSAIGCARIHHSFAMPLEKHRKRNNVFKLRLATNCIVMDTAGELCLCRHQGAEIFFQATSADDMNQWIGHLNLSAAMFSTAPLASAVSSRSSAMTPGVTNLVSDQAGKKLTRRTDSDSTAEDFLPWQVRHTPLPASRSSLTASRQRQWWSTQLMQLKDLLKSSQYDSNNQLLLEREIERLSTYVSELDKYLQSTSLLQKSTIPSPTMDCASSDSVNQEQETPGKVSNSTRQPSISEAGHDDEKRCSAPLFRLPNDFPNSVNDESSAHGVTDTTSIAKNVDMIDNNNNNKNNPTFINNDNMDVNHRGYSNHCGSLPHADVHVLMDGSNINNSHKRSRYQNNANGYLIIDLDENDMNNAVVNPSHHSPTPSTPLTFELISRTDARQQVGSYQTKPSHILKRDVVVVAGCCT